LSRQGAVLFLGDLLLAGATKKRNFLILVHVESLVWTYLGKVTFTLISIFLLLSIVELSKIATSLKQPLLHLSPLVILHVQ
jgi:hypothetical protein